MDKDIKSNTQTHFRVCNYCEAMCGIQITYDPSAKDNDKKINVTPDQNDPFSLGHMCPKASALGPMHFDESKLRHPVKKVGDNWEEISWAEAYDMVENNLKKVRSNYGPNSIASYLGNPVVHNLGMMLFVKTFIKSIGSKNLFSATSMDQLPHHFAGHFMFGHEMRIPVPDVDRTDYMILMGANPLASNGSIMTSSGIMRRLKEIQDRNGKFVVIDPRKTETAKIASEHHFIKPGTDAFLLLAMLHIIFRDNKVKLGELENHITNFDKLEPSLKDFTPEKVATITGLEVSNIERLTKEFTSHKRAVLYGRMGLSTQLHGGLCQWLINTINIVTGNFDTPGGMMFTSPAIELVREKKQKHIFGRWTSRARGLQEFAGEIPVSAMADEFLTEGNGAAKAFITICGNPVLSSPNGKRLDKALENTEFMVSIDNYINETTRHADVILPTPSGLEIDHYDLIFNGISVSNNAKFSEALFPPGKDRPYDWQVLKELTGRMSNKKPGLFDKYLTPRRIVNLGLMLGPYGKLSSPKRWFNGLSLKKVIDSKHGIRLGPLEPRVPSCLITPDKKINIAADVFLGRLEEVRTTEFPELYKEALRSKEDGDFALIGRRNVSSNNSWMHQVKILSSSKQVRCTVMMNPEDAKRHDIANGDDVKVISRVGDITLPVEVTDTMMPGVLSIPHGFGHKRKGTRIPIADEKPGVSVNDITDHERIDKLTGNAAFSGQRVRMEKVSSNKVKVNNSGKPITVVFGSQSGNSEMIADEIATLAGEYNLLANVFSMSNIDLTKLSKSERILVVTSTFGDGEMPDNAQDLWNAIASSDAPNFSNSFYAVLALGDRSYPKFCESGNQWDKRLAELGATSVKPITECDADYAKTADEWVQSILPKIGKYGSQEIVTSAASSTQKVTKAKYNKKNPYHATLITKRELNKSPSLKRTVHYEFSLEGYDGHYDAGDILHVIPRNSPKLVDELLTALNQSRETTPKGFDKSLYELLINDFEIRLLSKNILKFFAKHNGDKALNELLKKSEQDATIVTEHLADKDLLDLVNSYPIKEVEISLLLDSLSKIKPRAYSISSSLKKHPSEVHLTIATVKYLKNEREYHGACSTYLADQLEINQKVKCFFSKNEAFSVPKDGNAPMIMVGPGTGIAPFRGFIEEREANEDKGENWLFFGDRNSKGDFLYQEELEHMTETGLLTKLDLAFSRDQDEKIYVQDRMLENKKDIFNWLERGAYFFVCGDAKYMAKDVDRALHQIIRAEGNMDEQQANEYVKKLKTEKRYVRDVY